VVVAAVAAVFLAVAAVAVAVAPVFWGQVHLDRAEP
jgi:hypothetical protein